MAIESNLQTCVGFLNHLPAKQYWESKLPSEEDKLICMICSSYQHAPLQDRQEFRKNLESNGWQVLWSFLRRAAMLGARERSELWTSCGIIALTMCAEDPQTEYYDVLMDLSILFHSACMVGHPRRIFESGIAHVDNERIRRLILGFLDRDPHDQRLEAMGWEAIKGPHGIIYRFGKEPIPEAHL